MTDTELIARMALRPSFRRAEIRNAQRQLARRIEARICRVLSRAATGWGFDFQVVRRRDSSFADSRADAGTPAFRAPQRQATENALGDVHET